MWAKDFDFLPRAGKLCLESIMVDEDSLQELNFAKERAFQLSQAGQSGWI